MRTITEHFDQASYYESSGEYDKAIAEYSKAIRLDSKYALAYFNRGSLLKTQGKREEALAIVEEQIGQYKSQLLFREQNVQKWQHNDLYVNLMAELGIKMNQMFLEWLEGARERILESDDQ